MAKEYAKKVCKICGTEFVPQHSTQLCCTKECMRENGRNQSSSYYKKRKAEGKKNIVPPATKSKKKQQEEWAVIIRKCKEAGLSYGEAVAMGVIDG